MTAPASSATAQRPDVSAADAPSIAPPRPFELVGALLAGLPTALFSTVVAAAIAVPLVLHRPDDLPAALTIAGFAAIGLAVFVRRWWLSLKTLDEQPAWAFLLVPFFITAGAALAIAFAFAIRR